MTGDPSSSTDAVVAALYTLGAGRETNAIAHEQRLPARAAEYAKLRPRLPPALGAALQEQGIQQLYSHQAAAIGHARERRNVVVTTPTASGKSLCFHVPVLERLLTRPGTYALYLYPTKALIADQLRGLQALLDELPPDRRPRAAILSGDVLAGEREALRRSPPSILLANPDILHHEVLRNHRRWRRLLAGLETVVLDELHAYRGVFGSHVALILRRLRRLAAVHGSDPRFIAASATIGNPVELAQQLVGLPFTEVSGAAAGSSARRVLLWRSTSLESTNSGRQRGATDDVVDIFVCLLRHQRSAILFGRSRNAVERMLIDASQKLGSGWDGKLSAYRAGYSLHERQAIEESLRAGRIRGVVTTNALELGIDIGSLDAAVLDGYPGSLMSTWQQAGRVGRRDGPEAIITLVGGNDALDQYVLDHPQVLFTQSSEQAVIDPDNPLILLSHLLSAAGEEPLRLSDLGSFPEGAPKLVESLVSDALLSALEPWEPTPDAGSVHAEVNLRGTSRSSFRLRTGDTEIGSIEPPHVYREAHPGAIYRHNGVAYRVIHLDSNTREVALSRVDGSSTTTPVFSIAVYIRGEPLHSRPLPLGGVQAITQLALVTFSERITGYTERSNGRAGVEHALKHPIGHDLDTVGMQIQLPTTLGCTEPALHAAEHALVNAVPIALLCDRRDLGSTSSTAGEGRGLITLFDRYEGGIGLSARAFELMERLAQDAIAIIRSCRCTRGCPRCVQLPGCVSGNASLDKAGALAILEGRPISRKSGTASALPEQISRPPMQSDADLQSRMKRLAEDELRKRAQWAASIRVGDQLELRGYNGPVTVLEINGTRVKVQFVGFKGWTWTTADKLRPLGRR